MKLSLKSVPRVTVLLAIFTFWSSSALALNCRTIDDLIKRTADRANAAFEEANSLSAAANSMPGVWDTLLTLGGIWNPAPTSVEGYAQGKVKDQVLKACKFGLKHVVGGIDMTEKALESTDALIANQGSGVINANARSALIRGKKDMREVRRLLKWKRENCCRKVADTPNVVQTNPVPDKPTGTTDDKQGGRISDPDKSTHPPRQDD